MNTFRTFSEEAQDAAIRHVKSLLPEGGELAQLSFTGGRAFGWGGKNSDIDLRGFIVKEDWFKKCHVEEKMASEIFDITLYNIYSFDEPEVEPYRWKRFYDNSNPIFIHNDFDYHDDFMDLVEPQTIHHVFPHSLEMEINRLKERQTARAACHAYKEILIPLNYIYNREIETDVTQIAENEQFDLECLDDVVESYGPPGGDLNNPDGVILEVEALLGELREEMPPDNREISW